MALLFFCDGVYQQFRCTGLAVVLVIWLIRSCSASTSKAPTLQLTILFSTVSHVCCVLCLCIWVGLREREKGPSLRIDIIRHPALDRSPMHHKRRRGTCSLSRWIMTVLRSLLSLSLLLAGFFSSLVCSIHSNLIQKRKKEKSSRQSSVCQTRKRNQIYRGNQEAESHHFWSFRVMCWRAHTGAIDTGTGCVVSFLLGPFRLIPFTYSHTRSQRVLFFLPFVSQGKKKLFSTLFWEVAGIVKPSAAVAAKILFQFFDGGKKRKKRPRRYFFFFFWGRPPINKPTFLLLLFLRCWGSSHLITATIIDFLNFSTDCVCSRSSSSSRVHNNGAVTPLPRVIENNQIITSEGIAIKEIVTVNMFAPVESIAFPPLPWHFNHRSLTFQVWSEK